MKHLTLTPIKNSESHSYLASFLDLTARYIIPFVLIALAVLMKAFEPTLVGSAIVILLAGAFGSAMVLAWFKKAVSK